MEDLAKIHALSNDSSLGNGVYMVAGSFEARSVRATSMLPSGQFHTAVIFNYDEAQQSAMGIHHTTLMKRHMEQKCIENIFVPRCRFDDPFSVTRSLGSLVADGAMEIPVSSVTIDVTCFTNLHLLLLLQYLEDELGTQRIKVLHTESLSYATTFGGQLDCGVDRTIYLPYLPLKHSSMGTGLVAFLGHERSRLEFIVQELEPNIAVAILGHPGYSDSMWDYSRRVNETLIHRSAYDRQYRFTTAPANDAFQSRDILAREISQLRQEGCDSIYLAALGTKLQALGIHLVRRSGLQVRLLLAYSIPRRYERNLYTQGVGATCLCDLNTPATSCSSD